MSQPELQERLALIWLAHAAEPADGRVGALVRERGAVDALASIQAGSSGLTDEQGLRARLAHADPVTALEQAQRIGARIVHRGSREWPTQLDQLGDAAPFALWVLGAADLRLTMLRSIAVVGARACTPYGESVARDWASAFAGQSWTVVSGGALGVDGAVHRGALASGGMTICVLAGGIDVAYPRAHEQLLHRIADDGLLVSESPLGECVRRRRFLTRNRLIAALTRATVVVEAALRSGTTATANAAMALNRPVLAVPGPVSSPMSAGCHALIRDFGAVLASAPSDVLELLEPLGSPPPGRPPMPSRPYDSLTSNQARVLDALPAHGGAVIGELVRVAGISAPDVTAALAVLAARGLARPAGRGWELVGRA